ncbi:hypothetical protein V5F77_02405 [Xanthobacter sp. DSM 24535]|uniref:hypothetical protein n=1 Tax=Roseixanthobacter psychrophilus TaxID=3119917 RepID=UPI0037280EE5
MDQAAAIPNTTHALTPADLNTKVNHEPRISHRRLAEVLGYGEVHKMGHLVDRHSEALQRFGPFPSTVDGNGQKGRPGKTYWLNKKQALYICTKSETANATEVTIQMVEVFDAWQSGDLAEAAPDVVPVRGHVRRRPKPGFGTIIANTDMLYPFIERGDELIVEFCSDVKLDAVTPSALLILMNPGTGQPEPHWVHRKGTHALTRPDDGRRYTQNIFGRERELVASKWPVIGRVIGINKPTGAERHAALTH